MPKTKIFCDIADSKTIKEFNKKIVDGFTNQPKLDEKKAGAKSYEQYSKKLLKICRKNQFHSKFLLIILLTWNVKP